MTAARICFSDTPTYTDHTAEGRNDNSDYSFIAGEKKTAYRVNAILKIISTRNYPIHVYDVRISPSDVPRLHACTVDYCQCSVLGLVFTDSGPAEGSLDPALTKSNQSVLSTCTALSNSAISHVSISSATLFA
jgi:hypothetical protein